MTSTTMYYYTKVMSDLFLDTTHSGGGSFRTITSVEDFWKVMHMVQDRRFFFSIGLLTINFALNRFVILILNELAHKIMVHIT